MVEDNQIKAQVSPFAIRKGEIKVFELYLELFNYLKLKKISNLKEFDLAKILNKNILLS